MNGHWPPTSSTTRHMPQTADQTQFQRNEIIIFIFYDDIQLTKDLIFMRTDLFVVFELIGVRSKGMVCAHVTNSFAVDGCMWKTTLRTTQWHKCYTTDGSEMVRNLLFPLIAHRSHWWQHWLSNHLVAGYLVFQSTVDTPFHLCRIRAYASIVRLSCVSCGLQSCRFECKTMSN